MNQFRLKIFICSFIIFSYALLPSSSQVFEDMSAIYHYDETCLDVGSIYHYIIERGGKKPALDYWLYVAGNSSVGDLFDSRSIDGSGIVETNYLLNTETFTFSKAYSTNLLLADDKQWKNRAKWYDFENATLRIANLYDSPPPNDRLAYREDIPFPSTIWQSDLGLYFSVFFRFIKSPEESFTVCYNSFGHQIFMKAVKDGEEEVNGIPCIRFKVFGEGLWSKIVKQGGYVWMARDDSRHYLVKHTMKIAWSWQMRTFAMELKDITRGDEEAWKALQNTFVADNGNAR